MQANEDLGQSHALYIDKVDRGLKNFGVEENIVLERQLVQPKFSG